MKTMNGREYARWVCAMFALHYAKVDLCTEAFRLELSRASVAVSSNGAPALSMLSYLDSVVRYDNGVWRTVQEVEEAKARKTMTQKEINAIVGFPSPEGSIARGGAILRPHAA